MSLGFPCIKRAFIVLPFEKILDLTITNSFLNNLLDFVIFFIAAVFCFFFSIYTYYRRVPLVEFVLLSIKILSTKVRYENIPYMYTPPRKTFSCQQIKKRSGQVNF